MTADGPDTLQPGADAPQSAPETAAPEAAAGDGPSQPKESGIAEAEAADGASVPAEEAPPEASETATEETESAPPAKTPLTPEELARVVEALLFAAEEPLAPRGLARAAGSDSASVRKALAAIKAAYDEQRRPWDLTEVGGGYRLMTRPEFFPAIQRLKTQTAQRKLTQAALETLALIAYRQPIGRAEVESVRGVACGPVLRLLLDKKLIKIAGRGAGLGQPLLYGTTDYFLEHFGLKSIQDLPKMGEFKGT